MPKKKATHILEASPLPILYSFRRCPYAMRARLALQVAGIQVTHREISLKAKPQEMLDKSPKGTVPVLVLSNGDVLEESLDIMLWALKQHDPEGWLDTQLTEQLAFIQKNDLEFKPKLDAYKYSVKHPGKSPEALREKAFGYLQELENKLETSKFLFGNEFRMVDAALLPFIRQFAMVNLEWFQSSPFKRLNAYLEHWLQSPVFESIMQKHAVYGFG